MSAGVDKLFVPANKFADKIAAYDVLPIKLVHFAAVFLPVFEIVLAVLLMIPIVWRVAAWLIYTTSMIFLSVLLQTVQREINLDSCGCGGLGGESFEWAVGKNIFISLAITNALRLSSREIKQRLLVSSGVMFLFFSLTFTVSLSINSVRKNGLSIFSSYKTKEMRLTDQILQAKFENGKKKDKEASARNIGVNNFITWEDVDRIVGENCKEILLVDARSDLAFEQNPIYPQAINVSAENFTRDYMRYKDKLNSVKHIIIFCAVGCDTAINIAKSLREVGVTTRIEIVY
jgi:uncharacterized membrane protein YphA (DoxX/SURF4 family)